MSMEGKAASIVAQFHADPVRVEYQPHRKMSGVGVPERIRQNFLPDVQQIFLPVRP